MYENILVLSQQLIYLGSIYRLCLNVTLGVAGLKTLIQQIKDGFLSIQNTP